MDGAPTSATAQDRSLMKAVARATAALPGPAGDAMSWTSSSPSDAVEVTPDSDIQTFKEYRAAMLHPVQLVLEGIQADSAAATAQGARAADESLFEQLCQELLYTMASLEGAIEELMTWKDDFLSQAVPSTAKLQIALLLARLFRIKSDVHEPFFELIRQVRVHSKPWRQREDDLLRLEAENQAHQETIDIAIRKMEHLHQQLVQTQIDHKMALWDRLLRRVMGYFDTMAQANRAEKVNHLLEGMNLINLDVSTAGAAAAVDAAAAAATAAAAAGRAGGAAAGGLRGFSGLDAPPPFDCARMFEDIEAYIQTKPLTWRRGMKVKLRQFRALLRAAHPQYEADLVAWHAYPGARPRGTPYVSETQGGIAATNARERPGLRRAWWSAIDLRTLQTQREQHENTIDPELFDLDFDELTEAEAEQLLEHERVTGLVRSNSFSLRERYPDARVKFSRKPIRLPGERSDAHDGDGDGDHAPLSFAAGGAHDWASVASSTDLHDFTREEQEAIHKLTQNEDFLPLDLQKALDIENHLKDEYDAAGAPSTQSGGRDQASARERGAAMGSTGGLHLPAATSHAVLQSEEASRQTFSLVEVLELTALHRQQLQYMQDQYEKQVSALIDHTNRAQEAHNQQMTAQLQRSALLEERIRTLKSLSAGSVGRTLVRPSSHRTNASGADGQSTYSISTFAGDEMGARARAEASAADDVLALHPAYHANIAQRKRRQRQQREQEHYNQFVPWFMRKRVLAAIAPPTFMGGIWDMDFMQRTEYFGKHKTETHRALFEKISAMEQTITAQCLASKHVGLADPTPPSPTAAPRPVSRGGGLPAVFMPAPGEVPRRAGALSHEWHSRGVNPWGGKFKAPIEKATPKPHTVNLFQAITQPTPLPAGNRGHAPAGPRRPASARPASPRAGPPRPA
ncbi:hypothetical protein CXG81DRAFT_27804 [Caulochytrium protostelioides]|uniref:Uncharacterized protein n=1 Tax=Caulochytrium protostelioides TaxID=1555241 RepID=A0A4P9X344_9FUNG|nr:hypothetical protein CXG81DRAFT_27804 [Caulochytrium protostelioides]|eukprot:RKO99433.1 hypothetical protein CXG81DRAFT_27804 [Caulochytrium protostelioides]